MSTMKDYRTIVVGTDGSEFAGPVVARAAWLAVRDDADLVVVCAFAEMPRRTDARNVRTLGGDPRTGQVLGREAAGLAVESAMATARREGATVSATLLLDGEPSKALIATAQERAADLIVLGDNPSNAIRFAGVLLGLAGLTMLWIKEPPIVRDIDEVSYVPSAAH